MIDFTPLNNSKHVWVSVSGGTDSALLLYLIVKYLYMIQNNCVVTPWCYVDTTRPGNDQDVLSIIDNITKRIPYKIEPVVIDTITKPAGCNKKELVKPLWDRMFYSGRYDLYATALSAAPPIEVMSLNQGFIDSFNRITTENRHKEGREVSTNATMVIWSPFINLNKQHIADMYYDENLMDDLFPLTKSCISRTQTPCYNCFWCREKHWAFGVYDT
jgi:hypothetical protein